jgi:UDP-N-acetylglucosamine diphosphorylase/glucosamine-1-phosphate N-acetyltransferase
LIDGPNRDNFLPLTYTRPVAELRIGITTLKEKWEYFTGKTCSYLTEEYLATKFPLHLEADTLFIDAGLIPDTSLVEKISGLKRGEVLFSADKLLAYCSERPVTAGETLTGMQHIEYHGKITHVENSWDIFEMNDLVLRLDYERLTKGRKSHELSETNTVLGRENIFLEAGARVECATINATSGPVYIGSEAEIMEGAMIRGPLALCGHAAIKMGAKIYGATTLGPWCKAGGEVHNSVFTGYSNKAHDGYLGNAVLGEWCNLGADTNNSNLKNNYEKVKMWNYGDEKFVDTGLQFCGLIMGDHSKSGINTMFNTGTTVGVSANIFGSGFPRNIIPSFSWGGAGGFTVYTLEKALKTARIVMGRRNLELSAADIAILTHIFEISQK